MARCAQARVHRPERAGCYLLRAKRKTRSHMRAEGSLAAPAANDCDTPCLWPASSWLGREVGEGMMDL